MDEVTRSLLLLALMATLACGIIPGMIATRKMVELPFLYGVAYLILIFPSLAAGVANVNALTETQFAMYVCFSILCLLASFVGYNNVFKTPSRTALARVATERLGSELKQNPISPMTLLVPFLLGVSCTLLINPSEHGNLQGGAFAIQLFFARLVRPVAIIAWCQYLWSGSRANLLMAVLSFCSFLPLIVVSGRRSDTFFLALAIGIPLVIVARKRPTRKMAIGAMIVGLLIFVLWPTLRNFTKEGDFRSLAKVSVSESVLKKINGADSNEVHYAAARMEWVYRTQLYSGVAPFVNNFVNLYVSKTIFGESLKSALLMEMPTIEEVRHLAQARGARTSDETARWWLSPTGIGDAFFSLGWLGFVYFFGIGLLARYLFLRASLSSRIDSSILYCLFSIFIPYSLYDSTAAVGPFFLPYLAVYWIGKRLTKVKRRRSGLNRVIANPQRVSEGAIR